MLPLVQIKKMGIKDIGQVAGLIRRYFPYVQPDTFDVKEKLASGSHFFVPTLKDEVVGFLEVKLREKSAFIVGIATEPRLTNKGIGTTLLEHAISFAKRKGKNKISLVVKATNIKAINLYRRYGFLVKKTTHGVKEDVFLMSKQIEN